MNREDDEQLWDLLGRNRAPDLSPFFARNVLRQVRESETRHARFSLWIKRLIPASAVAVAVVAAAIFIRVPSQPPASAGADVDPVLAKIDVQDYEVVADLDNLLDSETPWEDDSTL